MSGTFNSIHDIESSIQLDPIDEPGNKYAVPQKLRSDLFLKVPQFGYEMTSIRECVVHNKPSHQATTYYLLEKDHERIC